MDQYCHQRTPSSFSIDSIINNLVSKTDNVDHLDPNEFFNQQKEIEGILSTAFDDITDIRHTSNFDENDTFVDCNQKDNRNSFDKKQSSKCNDQSNVHVNTSTPLITRNQQTMTNGILNRHNFKNNFNDIVEEEECTILDVESLDNDDVDGSHSDNLSLSTDHHFNNNHVDEEYILRQSPTSLHNNYDPFLNDVHIKDLCMLKQEFAQINTNYRLLQSKYQKIHQLNEENANLIDSQRAKIQKLEKQLKEERDGHESQRRLASMFESKVSSLEYQLNELQKGDHRNLNSDEQMKWFETLKLKHHKELMNLRTDYDAKIEKLNQTIQAKDDELISNCNILLKYKQEANYFQEKLKKLETQFKSKLQQEIQSAKDRTESNMLRSFDESMRKLKSEWEQKLQEDIDKIVDWFEDKDNVEKDLIESSVPKFDIRFEKLIDLYRSLKSFSINREQQIQTQIDRMDDAKRQLEKAIIEARLRNSSVSSTSSRSDLIEMENNGHLVNIPVHSISSPSLSTNNKKKSLHSLLDSNEFIENDKIMTKSRINYEKEIKDIRDRFESELDLLKIQLLTKEEETAQYRLKTNKYRQHIHSLKDRHDQDLNFLKNKFAKIIQELMDDKKQSQNNFNHPHYHHHHHHNHSSHEDPTEKSIRKSNSNGHGSLDFDLI
ncbi:uncharacterized protein LOC113799585 [Dermatophagoides pteronyssinus]|uniref:uncharacterized protein LOC113799585 n=1 Tax=Dermatophagoides pteronyssinus TaxID=6956 RepID=UPI003F66925D